MKHRIREVVEVQHSTPSVSTSIPVQIGPRIPRADEHERVKDPLPTRPPRPHPQGSARVLERFPAGAPRGSWPAEEFAAARRAEGIPATVVMDLATDSFIVKAVAV